MPPHRTKQQASSSNGDVYVLDEFIGELERAGTDEQRADAWHDYATSEAANTAAAEIQAQLLAERRVLPLVEHANRAAKSVSRAREAATNAAAADAIPL